MEPAGARLVEVVGAQGGHGRNDQRRAGGLGEGAEQVGAHAGDVAHVVAHVVCAAQATSKRVSRRWLVAAQSLMHTQELRCPAALDVRKGAPNPLHVRHHTCLSCTEAVLP